MPVRVVPARLDWLTGLVESDAVFVERFGVPVEPGWVGFPEALPLAVAAARDRDADPWVPIGSSTTTARWWASGASKGLRQPVESRSATPSRRGRGVATEAARWMIERARAAGVEVVAAHTLAEVNASTAVLERCGFVRRGHDR